MYRDWRHPKSRSQCSHAWSLKHLDPKGCRSDRSRKSSTSEHRKHQFLVQPAAMKNIGCRVHSWQKRADGTMCQVIHRFTLHISETACRSSSKIRGRCVSSACSNIPRNKVGRSGQSRGSGRAGSVRRHSMSSVDRLIIRLIAFFRSTFCCQHHVSEVVPDRRRSRKPTPSSRMVPCLA